MVDTGFGGDGATKPLPLVSGIAVQNLGTQEIRLIQDNIPEQVDKSRRYWIYQYRNAPHVPWNSYYAFPEWEFSETDFGIINYWASACPQSFQTFTILVVKFLRTGDQVTGKAMLINDTLKQNLGGKTEVVAVFKSESERIKALEHWFGLTLTLEERFGIEGHVTEIR